MLIDLPLVAQTLDYTCGAACFDSMFNYFMGYSHGEMHFAEKLDALRLGYTPPMNIVTLARDYGFFCEMTEGASIEDLSKSLSRREIIFVTWWDEDAGHYSLVKHIEEQHITLMDPWVARQGVDHRLTLEYFIPNWHLRGSRLIRVAKEI